MSVGLPGVGTTSNFSEFVSFEHLCLYSSEGLVLKQCRQRQWEFLYEN